MGIGPIWESSSLTLYPLLRLIIQVKTWSSVVYDSPANIVLFQRKLYIEEFNNNICEEHRFIYIDRLYAVCYKLRCKGHSN